MIPRYPKRKFEIPREEETMNKALALFLIFSFSCTSFFLGCLLTKKTFIPITRCNVQLHKMQNYYLDNIYHKFGIKEAKDERKNIKQYCDIKLDGGW
jgi:hypothetical protein